jgi:hypothetical protein
MLNLRRRAPVDDLPLQFLEPLDAWIEDGILPDHQLLEAILRNDLGMTVSCSLDTPEAWHLIRRTIIWLSAYAPPHCYGSRRHVDSWEARGGMRYQ